MPLDIFSVEGDPPQDWPPGPFLPAPEGYEGVVPGTLTDVGTPNPPTNQGNTSTPADSQPPVNPSSLPGVPQNLGPGVNRIPPTPYMN